MVHLPKEGLGETEMSIYQMEMRLLEPEVRSSPEASRPLFNDDFLEVGSSGRLYDRDTIIAEMASASKEKVLVRDFQVRVLSADVALCTYRSIGQGGAEAHRTSIWVREDNDWTIVFHQGTRVPETRSRPGSRGDPG